MRLAQLSIAVAILAISAAVIADYDLSWYKIAGGGETLSEGGPYSLGGTIGQRDAGTMSGGSFDLAGGFWAGVVVCPLADLNCDGVVSVLDLLILLENWGPCDDPSDCPADLTGPDGEPDGVVDVHDLLELLSNWG